MISHSKVEPINKILVVDDEIEMSKTFVRHLKREGYFLKTASSIEEARGQIKDTLEPDSQFDLIILDMMMLSPDALELVEWVKRFKAYISIMVISGLGNADFLQKAIRSEVDTFCLTPLTPEKIMGLVHVIEKKRQAMRQSNFCR